MALVLAITVVPDATAAVKKGASCKKAGKTRVVDSRKFICVKKGSKLVWNKGKAVKKAPSAAATVAAGYTMTQVKSNSSAAKCWSAIKGNVYDLTNWINQHPGGSSAIKSLCGLDGSAAFAVQHQGQQNPESRLKSYLLGPLAK